MRRLALLLCGGSGGYLQGIHVHHDYIIKREQPTTVCHLCNAGDFGPSEPFFYPTNLIQTDMAKEAIHLKNFPLIWDQSNHW